ncbi:sulfotransferase family 2 domain-containing protein [Methylophaga sp.]|uniref:sulfotransferase family 2 domain-containing protein n=1 Tax=Methylophaga sp. TaxID=2024840 RepID=UPI0013FF9B8D|nr:sulfotransferase family 2 domain-containing protein [Methylophaga sp.]MTI64699.1 hypothetical protein [Methylophaga sp.]
MIDDKTKLIFLHVPKATGTSAKMFFRTVFGEDEVVWLGEEFSREDLLNGNPEYFSHRVVGGHFSYELSKKIPGEKKLYISVVREPISRAISLYRFIERTDIHHLHKEAQSKTMLEMIESCASFRGQISNLQVKYMSDLPLERQPEATFEHAINNIEHSAFYLASLQNVSELFQRLGEERVLNVTGVNYGKHKVAPRPTDHDPLWQDSELIEKIKEINKEDAKLYEWVNEKGVIAPTISQPSRGYSEKPKKSNTQENKNKGKVVFLHIPKTGGTTLHNLISESFPKPRICPERFNNLISLDKSELDSYGFFSGHYDWRNVEHIPGNKKVITILRNPRARILSLYHFWRSHTWQHINQHNLGGPRQAKTYDLEKFLSLDDPAVVANIDNALTRNLIGRVFAGSKREFLYPEAEVVDRAIHNLETLHALGVLEYTRFSVEKILRSLDIEPPLQIPRERDSSSFEGTPAMEKVEKQSVSLASESILYELTKYDDAIYQYVLDKYHPLIKVGDRFEFTTGNIGREDFFEEGWQIVEEDGVVLPLQGDLTLRFDDEVKGIEFEFESRTLPVDREVGEISWQGSDQSAKIINSGKSIRLSLPNSTSFTTNKFGIYKARLNRHTRLSDADIVLTSLKVY